MAKDYRSNGRSASDQRVNDREIAQDCERRDGRANNEEQNSKPGLLLSLR